MSDIHKSGNSFFALSRGIHEYQGAYSHAAINLYIYLLGNVEWRVHASAYGSGIFSFMTLRKAIHADPRTLKKTLRELGSGHKVPGLSRNGQTAPPFIKWTELGKGRGKKLYIKILKVKLHPRHYNEKGKPGRRQGSRAVKPQVASDRQKIKRTENKTNEIIDNLLASWDEKNVKK